MDGLWMDGWMALPFAGGVGGGEKSLDAAAVRACVGVWVREDQADASFGDLGMERKEKAKR